MPLPTLDPAALLKTPSALVTALLDAHGRMTGCSDLFCGACRSNRESTATLFNAAYAAALGQLSEHLPALIEEAQHDSSIQVPPHAIDFTPLKASDVLTLLESRSR